jgi:excisionase family DNA binding protein
MNELITLTLTWTIPEHRAELFWKNPPSVTIGGMRVDLQSPPVGTQGRPVENKTPVTPQKEMSDSTSAPSVLETRATRTYPGKGLSEPVESMTGLMPGKFYSLKEVAAHMNCSPKTIYRLIQARELSPCRFSRHYRFKGATVIAYLELQIPKKHYR